MEDKYESSNFRELCYIDLRAGSLAAWIELVIEKVAGQGGEINLNVGTEVIDISWVYSSNCRRMFRLE